MNVGADSLRILIGMAEADANGLLTGLCSGLFSSGEGDMPAGVDTLSEKMKSSRFMVSL